MNTGQLCRVLLLLTLLGGHGASAQEGHPLAGTWQGLWGTSPDARNFLTLILHWDGESISGDVNPGRFAGSINDISMDSSTWTVSFDLNVIDRLSGDSRRLTVAGRLLNIGSPERMVLGELTGSGDDSHFKIKRQ